MSNSNACVSNKCGVCVCVCSAVGVELYEPYCGAKKCQCICTLYKCMSVFVGGECNSLDRIHTFLLRTWQKKTKLLRGDWWTCTYLYVDWQWPHHQDMCCSYKLIPDQLIGKQIYHEIYERSIQVELEGDKQLSSDRQTRIHFLVNSLQLCCTPILRGILIYI